MPNPAKSASTIKTTPAKTGHIKRTVYLDKAPEVEEMLKRACRTRVFSYLAVEALREWLIRNGFADPKFDGMSEKRQ